MAPGSFLYQGTNYGYRTLLTVTDDPFLVGTPNVTISAVEFKVSDKVTGGKLYTAPASTVLGTWVTSLNNLSSNGCTGSGQGKVCSQSATDPADFVASSIGQTWGWYFNTNDPLFSNLDGAHVGAKLAVLTRPGQLLSQEFHYTIVVPEIVPTPVPEPAAALLVIAGLLLIAVMRTRAVRSDRARNAMS